MYAHCLFLIDKPGCVFKDLEVIGRINTLVELESLWRWNWCLCCVLLVLAILYWSSCVRLNIAN
jgi:hypothetical protein